MKKLLFFLIPFFVFPQVGINTTTPDPNSILHLESNNKGLLLTRVALIQSTNAAPMSQHIAGMVVYNTATSNDVVPGLYVNDGTKWTAICDKNIFQNQIDNINQQIQVKRAIIVAGQSNTYYGAGNNAVVPSDFASKGMMQLGRNEVNLQEVPLTFYNGYHHTPQQFRASFSAMFCYYYYNQLKAAHPSQDVKILLIPCGAGSSSWAEAQYPGNSWRTNSSYWSDLITRIKWAKSQGYQIDAILWHQGESDTNALTINYKDIIKNFIQSVREQVDNATLPFVLGEMLPSWVASNATRPAYQAIINSIPNEVPYTYTVSGSGLTNSDVIHYSADAHLQLGLRYFDGFTAAKLNASPIGYSAPASGNHLLLNHNSSGTNYFPNIFTALRNDVTNPNPTDPLYSKLGDIWKYKNSDGYYHFRLEVVNGTGISGGIFEWKQKFNPFGLNETQIADRNSCIVINNTIGLNTSANQGFASLVYDNPSAITNYTTLFHADVRASWWFAIGQTTNFSSRIPIVEGNDTVNHIRLYAIKN